jgi:hypothetical protein
MKVGDMVRFKWAPKNDPRSGVGFIVGSKKSSRTGRLIFEVYISNTCRVWPARKEVLEVLNENQ